MFGGQAVPGVVKYLLYCLNIDLLWVLLKLIAISMGSLIRRIDRRTDFGHWQGKPLCR